MEEFKEALTGLRLHCCNGHVSSALASTSGPSLDSFPDHVTPPTHPGPGHMQAAPAQCSVRVQLLLGSVVPRYKVGMFCVADFEASAREALDRNAWGYYSSGANQQQTLRDNVEAYSRYWLVYSSIAPD